MKHFLFFIFLSVTTTVSCQAATNWVVRPITNNETNDHSPVVNSTHVAWIGTPDDQEVFVYDGSSTTQLSESSMFNEQNLFASDKYIAWNRRDYQGGDDIFLYNGTSVTRITNDPDGIDNYRPRVSGEHMVWGKTGGIVLLYNISDGASIEIAADDKGYENSPWIDGDFISFTSNYGASRLYYYNILTGEYARSGVTNGQSKINTDYLVYPTYDGDTDISAVSLTGGVAIGPPNNNTNDFSLQLDGKHIVWITDNDDGYSRNESLYFKDLSDPAEPTFIADNVDSYNNPPSIHGNRIVYAGYDGNDMEIFVYEIDSGINTQITNNDLPDTEPQIWGDRIVWTVEDSLDKATSDDEIMLATPGAASNSSLMFPIKSENGKVSIISL